MSEEVIEDIRCIECYGLYEDHGEGKECEFFRSPLNQATAHGSMDPLSALFNLHWQEKIDEEKHQYITYETETHTLMRGKVKIGYFKLHFQTHQSQQGQTPHPNHGKRILTGTEGRMGLTGKKFSWHEKLESYYGKGIFLYENPLKCRWLLEDEYKVFMNELLGIEESDDVKEARQAERDRITMKPPRKTSRQLRAENPTDYDSYYEPERIINMMIESGQETVFSIQKKHMRGELFTTAKLSDPAFKAGYEDEITEIVDECKRIAQEVEKFHKKGRTVKQITDEVGETTATVTDALEYLGLSVQAPRKQKKAA